MNENTKFISTNDNGNNPVRVQLDPPPYQEFLDHISDIARSASSTLFSFLTILLYFGVMLAAHRDADFFAANSGTKLPVLGVDIPPELFFLGAPIFILGVFVYLQVYLVKLWYALVAVPAVVPTGDFPDRSLDQATYPWIIIDAVLRWKGHLFKRPLGWLASIGTFILGWALAPLLIGAFWFRSMPYHHEGLTLVLGAFFWMSIAIAWAGRRLAHRIIAQEPFVVGPLSWIAGFLLMIVLGLASWSTTEAGLWSGDGRTPLPGHCKSHRLLDGIDCFIADFARNGDNALLVPAMLSGAKLSKRPDDYLPRRLSRTDFRHTFILRQRNEYGPSWRDRYQGNEWEAAIEDEFETRRAAQRRLVARRDLSGADLRRADLSRADLTAAELSNARLSRSFLQYANLEGANLKRANLTYAILSNTQLSSARLEEAQLVRTNMFNAQLEHANLKLARLYGSFLRGVNLTRADLTQVKAKQTSFREAILDHAKLVSADLRKARLAGASLIRAQLQHALLDEADLSNAKLAGANLQSANFRGATLAKTQLQNVKLMSAWLDNASLFRADLSKADLTAARLKGASFAGAVLHGVVGLANLANTFGDSVAAGSLPSDVAVPAEWKKIDGFPGNAVHDRSWKAWTKANGLSASKKP